jgi:hypothetical protein
MHVLAVLILLHGAAVTVPTSTRARVLGQHGWRAQSKMFFGAPPPPPPPSLGASLQRQLGEVAPFLVSAVTITGALLGAYNFIDNRIEASSKEAAAASKELAMQIAAASKEAAAANKELAMQIAAANKELAMQIAAVSKETAMQIAAVSKETAMQIADLSKETAIGVVVSICIAVIALVVAVIAVQQTNR